jgi:fructose transport system substrate-binding protein
MRKNILLILSILTVFSMLLAACAAPAAAPAPAAETEAAPAEAAPAEQATEAAAAAPAEGEEILIGLVTKFRGNPFFVKMEEGATQAAEAKGVKLMTGYGEFDGDNEGQVTAIENMITAGVKGILLVPNQSTAIVPTVQKAREAGVTVIALDTPLDPEDASDGLFATDNFKAGELIGQYARAALGDAPAKIAMLDGTAGTTVSQLRHDGFLKGFGIEEGDPAIVCQADTNGMIDKAQPAMENCLSANPDINVVYTVNEPAAFGANTALTAAGTAENAIVVSVDGSCEGVRGVKDGKISANSMQYPLLMASMGVDAIVDSIKTGTKVSGYTDTGVALIADKAIEGVDSKDTTFGLENCWGE